MRITVIPLLLALAACSSPPAPETKQTKTAASGTTSAGSKKHPLAKYIELSGFRLAEAGGGKLKIKFVIINHSEADIGDIGLKVRLTTSAAKPGDEPISEFETKVAAVGPEEVKDAVATVSTKLRIYELPDWQFLKADFDITSPEP